MLNRVYSHFAVLVAFCGIFIISIATANAFEIKDVTSPKGIHAWLVQNDSVPIIAIRFSFEGGSAQDPQGEEGLMSLMTGLLDEGAGNLISQEFQGQLDDLGAEISFSATKDRFQGGFRVVAENRDAAVKLLALALEKPRFDQDAIDRIRGQLVAALKAKENDPATIAQERFNALIYGKHPYGRRENGTPETLKKITRNDLIKAHNNIFSTNNLKIAIVGPVTPEQAKQMIDEIFGSLPATNHLQKVSDTKLHLGGMVNVNYNLPQTSITLVYDGVRRKDPEFFAAYLMNYILGGPGLTSRLFMEVRENQGLAYSIGSTLVGYDHADALIISTATESSQTEKTLANIRKEVRRLIDDGVSEQELKDAKSYVKGSYAIQTMGSSSAIASTLVGLQESDLPINYIEQRGAEINAVTAEQIKEMAKKLLSSEPSILVVGPAQN